MKPAIRFWLVLGSLLAACGGGGNERPEMAADSIAETAPPSSLDVDGPRDQADGEDPVAAVAVVREYYRAIAAGEHDRAWALWGGGGRGSSQTLEEFRRGFAETDSVDARLGPAGRVEGAAGSRYVTVPVALRAWTTGGREQCFAGPITLRRAVVPGATPEEMSWRLYSADLVAADLTACGPDGDAGREAVVALVERFGARLADVPLSAPPERLRALIRESYGALVTPALLETWLASPAAAPGREVSSPWPDRIEIGSMRRVAPDRWEVAGEVVLLTSVEEARGGDAGREPVDLEVSRTAEGWRVSAWSD